MPLPKIETPYYSLDLPSTGKKIEYRPFLVKEEKVLMLAMETENQKDITTAVKNVLKNCIKTRGVKVDALPTFDIEYIFLHIRGKSVGEKVDVRLVCPDDGRSTVDVGIFLDEIQIKRDPEHINEIDLGSGLKMQMKYPSLEQFIKTNFDFSDEANVEQTFELLSSCIDIVYNEEESWAASDCSKKELMDFMESMNSSQFKQIEKFFTTMPKLSHEVTITNPNTKVESTVVLEGLSSFFG